MKIEQHNLNSLREIIRKLEDENKRLKAKLREYNINFNDDNLQRDEVQNEEDFDIDQANRIKSFEINKDLASRFYGRFWGRTDVYAKRSGKGSYFPQCFNSFTDKCPRQHGIKMQCGKCLERKFKGIDADVLIKHFKGNNEDGSDVIGIYPLLEDNKCRLIVFDFDDHNKEETVSEFSDELKQEINVLRRICVESGFMPLVERSRSGKGAHIWLFFEKPISASLARNFAFSILDKGLSIMNLTSFRYYDRVYPSQDKSDGLGNLVALPLQGKALKQGNSAFVDENFNAYEDQLAILFSTKMITEREITSFILQTKVEETDGKGLTFGFDNLTRKKPWEKEVRFNKSDVIEKLYITKANGIYVDGLNLLPEIQNQIRVLAAFSNPVYFKNLRMGLSNYNNSSYIYLGEDINGYICLPRGVEDKLIEKLEDSKIDYEIVNKRNIGRPIRVKFKGELTDEQKEAVSKLLDYENGILDATMAFGKTVVGAYLISKKRLSTLIIVESTSLLEQWREKLHSFLDIDEPLPKYKTEKGREKQRKDVVGIIGAGKDSSGGIIDIAMDASLANREDLDELLGKYGMIIYDECHHASNNTAIKILKKVNSKYIYGLTATLNRSDKLEKITLMMIGPIRHSYSARQRALKQGIGHYIYPRFTNVVDINEKKDSINKLYEIISNSINRNEMIIKDVEESIKNGRSPLVLTKFKKHAEVLYELLKGKADEVYLIYGDNSSSKNKEIREKLSNLGEDRSLIIVATGQMVGEGFDLPRLDTLMLALPVSTDSGRLRQYMGRINRDYPTKKETIVFDYVDRNIRIFENMYYKRLKVYHKDAYEIKDNLVVKQTANYIYNDDNYLEVYERDLIEANTSVVISSPSLAIDKINRFINLIKGRQEAGIEASVVTSLFDGNIFINENVQLEAINLLESSAINVIQDEDVYENYIVIDKKIVWHGNIEFLGKNDYRGTAVRVENERLAEELVASSK